MKLVGRGGEYAPTGNYERSSFNLHDCRIGSSRRVQWKSAECHGKTVESRGIFLLIDKNFDPTMKPRSWPGENEECLIKGGKQFGGRQGYIKHLLVPVDETTASG